MYLSQSTARVGSIKHNNLAGVDNDNKQKSQDDQDDQTVAFVAQPVTQHKVV